jgi:hypothetical protein
LEIFIVNDEFDDFSSIFFANDEHASAVFAERDDSVNAATARRRRLYSFDENTVGIVNVDSFLIAADNSPI